MAQQVNIGDTVRPNLFYGEDKVVSKVGACTYTFSDGSSGHIENYDRVPRKSSNKDDTLMASNNAGTDGIGRDNGARDYGMSQGDITSIAASLAGSVTYRNRAAPSTNPWIAPTAAIGAVVPDPIARPHHYARYAIEPITFIMANDLPFCVGNVVKYVLRYDAKNGREDLLKARRYLDMILEDMDRKAKGTVGDCVGRPL